MNNLINRIKDIIYEYQWLKNKPCAACKHLNYFMGSVGICEAKEGCPASRMRDYSDFCDCGCFKKKGRK